MNINRKTLGTLKKALDCVHSRYIRARDGHRCVVCGSGENLECGHIFTRTAKSTRWDTEPDGNCHCQCHRCNMRHVENPEPYMRWYIRKHGFEKLAELKKRFLTLKRFNDNDLLEKINEIQKLYCNVSSYVG
jgi:hypothetical protein